MKNSISLIISIVLAFISSCASAPARKDVNAEPISIKHDKIKQYDRISSNRMFEELLFRIQTGAKTDIFMNIDLIVREAEKSVTVMANISVDRGSEYRAIVMNTLHSLCDNEQPISSSRQLNENWRNNLNESQKRLI